MTCNFFDFLLSKNYMSKLQSKVETLNTNILDGIIKQFNDQFLRNNCRI